MNLLIIHIYWYIHLHHNCWNSWLVDYSCNLRIPTLRSTWNPSEFDPMHPSHFYPTRTWESAKIIKHQIITFIFKCEFLFTSFLIILLIWASKSPLFTKNHIATINSATNKINRMTKNLKIYTIKQLTNDERVFTKANKHVLSQQAPQQPKNPVKNKIAPNAQIRYRNT